MLHWHHRDEAAFNEVTYGDIGRHDLILAHAQEPAEDLAVAEFWPHDRHIDTLWGHAEGELPIQAGGQQILQFQALATLLAPTFGREVHLDAWVFG